MKFTCPRCGKLCGLRQTACPCGFPLTLGSVVSFYWSSLFGSLRSNAAIRCPTCNVPVPPGTNLCPNNHPLTVEAAVGAVVNKPRNKFLNLCLHASPGARRFLQWAQLIFSAVLLWWLANLVEQRNRGGWVLEALLSSFYVTILLVLLRWLVPQSIFRAIAAYATWRVKLALVFHAFSAMLLLHLLVTGWWMRAALFAIMIGLSVLSLFLFSRFGVRIVSELAQALLGPPKSQPYDPRSPQGRNVRVE